jgi:hypothetical protein
LIATPDLPIAEGTMTEGAGGEPALDAALDRFVAWVQRACAGLEARFGLAAAALILGGLLLGLAAVQSTPSLKPVAHGVLFARLSEVPLDFAEENWVQMRILTPLLGYLLHLRGRAFIALPPVFGWLFLASVYWHYRRRGFGEAASLGLGAMMALSTLLLFPLYGAGYVDPTSTLLLFWCFSLPDRPALASLLYGLALFNHESALFALPWVVLPGEGERLGSRRTLSRLALCVLAVALLLLWRDWVSSQVSVRFSTEFYLHRVRKNVGIVQELFPLGVFEAFRLFWFFPVFTLLDSIAAREPRRALWLALVVGSACAQFLFVYDVSRLTGLLAFPAVLRGVEHFRERRGERTFTRLAWALVGLSFLVPAYEVKPPKVVRYWPLWWAPFRPPNADITWPPPPSTP